MKEKHSQTLETIKSFWDEIGSKIYYWLPLAFILTLSYFNSVCNRAISIDDLAQSYYYGSENIKFRSFRWGQAIINRLFSTIEFTHGINEFIGVCFYFVSAVLLCTILYQLVNKKLNNVIYAVVACLFVSYPLINEIWQYYECLTIPCNFAIIFYCTLYIILNKKLSIIEHITIGFILSFVMSGYESLIFAYISLVLMILFLEVQNNKNHQWISQGIVYAIPLFIALIFRYIIGYLFIFALGQGISNDGNTTIAWLSSFKEGLIGVLYNAWYFGIRSFSYLPIAIFFISFIIFVFYTLLNIKKYTFNILLISLSIVLSLFLLSFIQGEPLAYRCAQTIQIFVPFVFFVIFKEINNKVLQNLFIILSFILCIRQSIYLNQLISLDIQRSENEEYVLRNVGYRLTNEFDTSKTVVFCGQYSLGEKIESQIVVKDGLAENVENYFRNLTGHRETLHYNEFVRTNVNSVINWGVNAFDGQTMMKEYLSFLGFDINVLSDWDEEKEDELLKRYYKIALDKKMKPYDILEMDDYILVYFGEIYDNEKIEH